MSIQGDSAVLTVVRDVALDQILVEQEEAEQARQAVLEPAARGADLDIPTNSLELALIARRYVRSMIRVLVQIAQDINQSPAARVQAAKEIINRAVLEKSALDQIDDVRLKAMAEALVAKINAERQKELTFDAKL